MRVDGSEEYVAQFLGFAGPMPFSGTGFLWAPRDMGVVNVFGTNTCPVAQSPGQSLDLALQNRPEKLLLLWPYAEGNESIMSHSSQDTGPVEFYKTALYGYISTVSRSGTSLLL